MSVRGTRRVCCFDTQFVVKQECGGVAWSELHDTTHAAEAGDGHGSARDRYDSPVLPGSGWRGGDGRKTGGTFSVRNGKLCVGGQRPCVAEELICPRRCAAPACRGTLAGAREERKARCGGPGSPPTSTCQARGIWYLALGEIGLGRLVPRPFARSFPLTYRAPCLVIPDMVDYIGTVKRDVCGPRGEEDPRHLRRPKKPHHGHRSSEKVERKGNVPAVMREIPRR